MKPRALFIVVVLLSLAIQAGADNLGFSKGRPLIFGLDSNYEPLQYIDRSGMPKGYDVEFTQELMKRLNVPFTYAPNTWDKISDDVLSGRVDLGMMVYSPYRKNITNYSRAVFRLYYQIVFRNSERQSLDVRNLSGKSIAFMASRPLTDTLTKVGATLNVIGDLHRGIIELSKGKYDAVICFRYQSKYIINHYKLKNLATQDLTLTPREYCYVSHDKRLIDAINVELEKMETEGAIAAIYGDDITSQFGSIEIPLWVWVLLVSLVIVFLVVFILIQQKHQRLLRREMERAQRSEQLKTVFLGNVSHALRTPLNAIIGFSDVLRSAEGESIGAEEQQQMLGLINANGKQLLYFINELLQLSNIESNELTFDRTQVQLREVMEQYADEVRPHLEEGVELRVEGDDARVYIDEKLMRLVTRQFLDNAAKHTHQGSITLRYGVADGRMRIEVQDTGEGLPASLRENIFALLGDRNTYVQDEVPGLGLTICKAVVDRCGGQIGAESPAEGGTVFWHWVPLTVAGS